MLLVLLTWLYLFFTLINLGFGLVKITRLTLKHFFITFLLGLVATTILAAIWAIFGRINWEFHVFLLVVQALLFLFWKEEIKTLYNNILKSYYLLSKKAKGFLIVVAIVTSAQSASPSRFVDNETYYVQTIKWLTEFGLVKGLGNLHIFLGQTSGWHILQSVFSFSFFGNCYNDLNGFCLLMATFFSASCWDLIQKKQNSPLLIVAIFPIANVLLFPFLGSSSPDFAVYLVSYFVFYYFLEYYEDCTVANFNLLFILTTFAVFLKITSFSLLLLPLFLWVLHFKKVASKVFVSYFFGVLMLSIAVIKNTILTGLPLFPSNSIAFDLPYTLPKEVYQFSFNPAKRYDFFISSQEFKKLDSFAILIKWLFNSKIYSVFNSILLLLLVGIPIFLKKFLNERKYWVLYSAMILQCLFLIGASPQYRFLLNYGLFFGLLLLSHFIHYKKRILTMCLISLLPLLFLVLFSQKIKSNFQNKLSFKEEAFTLNTILYPAANSQLRARFHSTKMGNLKYYSPDSSTYIWATGNGKLPCVSDTQIKYLKIKTGFVPQLRTRLLKDGFYSQKCKTP